MCVGGLGGYVAALHSQCVCCPSQLRLRPQVARALRGWAHRKSAKRGSALALVGVGGSLPGSFLLLSFVKLE